MQRLTITTDPTGATVSLSKMGVRMVSGGYFGGALVTGQVPTGPFTDPPVVVGTSPLEIQFPLEEEEAGVSVVGIASASVTKTYKEGIISAENDETRGEVRVQFSGSPQTAHLKLKR